jgi:hypothetical protein
MMHYQDITIKEGPVVSYLGMTFDFTIAGQVRITQAGFIAETLSTFQVTGQSRFPAKHDLFSISQSDPLDKRQAEEFHSGTATLLYLAKRTRPDILLPVAFLTTRVREPTVQDRDKLDKVFRYLNTTKTKGLTLKCDNLLCVCLYTDASFAVHKDFKSHTGSVITLGWGSIFARSSKQSLNTTSSTESELVGVSDTLRQAIWARQFLIAQGYNMPPLDLFQDNKSTIFLVEKGRSASEKTRHISIRYFWVKDVIDRSEATIKHMPTEDMTADILTKPLQGKLFLQLREKLLGE